MSSGVQMSDTGRDDDLRWRLRMQIRMRRTRRAAKRYLTAEAAARQADGFSLRDLVTSSTTTMSARSSVLLGVVIACIAAVALIHHLIGVDWGDDFALYLRQAKALVTGLSIDQVVQDTRFSLDHSGWHTFSPYVYPWGWPLLLAPFYALFGLDYELFKGLQVVALCVYLVVFFAIVRRRAGALPASVLMLLVGLSPLYLSHTGTVLSDLPYLCFVGLSLWWMDRCRSSGLLHASGFRLLLLGSLVAYAMNIRPEGISLVATLIALHVAVLGRQAIRDGSLRSLKEMRWGHALLPYATLALGVAVFQLLLPNELPNAPGTGLDNASTHLAFYQDIFAEHVGLKDIGRPMALFGNEALARIGVMTIVVLAVIGLVGRLLERFEEDVTLAAYLGAASFIMLVSPYQEGRYLLSITPLVAYFAYQAIPTIARVVAGLQEVRPALSLVSVTLFAGLVALHVADVAHNVDYHLEYEFTVNGPETSSAQEMFSVVRDRTEPDDVILFFRARAMTFYTDRRAIQGSDLDQVLDDADWWVMEKGSTYSQALITDAEAPSFGLAKSWESDGWVLWDVE
jgi:hypothetical protein